MWARLNAQEQLAAGYGQGMGRVGEGCGWGRGRGSAAWRGRQGAGAATGAEGAGGCDGACWGVLGVSAGVITVIAAVYGWSQWR